MADSPAPTTTIPLTLPPNPEEGASRITRGTRQGWKLVSGVVIWDDGEKEMPTSGKSDAEKRAEALAIAMGTLPALSAGADSAAIEQLRVRSAGTADPEVNERRKTAAKAKAAAPGQDKTIPLSAEAVAQDLRVEARQLVGLEVSRVEQLKELAIENTLSVGRDGHPVLGNVPQQLHDAILAALSAVERGDLAHTAAALAELKRWTAIGGPQ
jgi:anti-sigma28 factor (negative regulator of flagellin synthesis)